MVVYFSICSCHAAYRGNQLRLVKHAQWKDYELNHLLSPGKSYDILWPSKTLLGSSSAGRNSTMGSWNLSDGWEITEALEAGNTPNSRSLNHRNRYIWSSHNRHIQSCCVLSMLNLTFMTLLAACDVETLCVCCFDWQFSNIPWTPHCCLCHRHDSRQTSNSFSNWSTDVNMFKHHGAATNFSCNISETWSIPKGSMIHKPMKPEQNIPTLDSGWSKSYPMVPGLIRSDSESKRQSSVQPIR